MIADEHHLVRHGLRCLLDKERGIQVVDEVADGQDTVESVAWVRPDVVVMNVEMPGIDGIEAAGRIRAAYSKTRVVMLSKRPDPFLISKVLSKGASGFVCLDSSTEELVLAIRTAYRGSIHRSRKQDRAVSTIGQSHEGSKSLPTAREHQILHLIASGQTNRQVSEKLRVSVKTVEHHRNNLMKKLNSHNLADLIHTATRLGLLDQEV